MSGTSLSDLSVCPVSCEWSVPWSTRFRPKVKNYKVETDPLRARVMAALAAAPAGGGADLASAFGADSLMVAANGTPTLVGEIHAAELCASGMLRRHQTQVRQVAS